MLHNAAVSFMHVCNFYTNHIVVSVGTKISMIYINNIYHDSIMIFLSENIMIFWMDIWDISDIFKISTFIVIIYLLF